MFEYIKAHRLGVSIAVLAVFFVTASLLTLSLTPQASEVACPSPTVAPTSLPSTNPTANPTAKPSVSPTTSSSPPAASLQVVITSPADGAVVSGTTTVTASISGGSGGNTATLTIDGTTKAIYVVNGDMATFLWDTSTVTSGVHTVTVSVTDKDGHTSRSSITVTVKNAVASPSAAPSTRPAPSPSFVPKPKPSASGSPVAWLQSVVMPAQAACGTITPAPTPTPTPKSGIGTPVSTPVVSHSGPSNNNPTPPLPASGQSPAETTPTKATTGTVNPPANSTGQVANNPNNALPAFPQAATQDNVNQGASVTGSITALAANGSAVTLSSGAVTITNLGNPTWSVASNTPNAYKEDGLASGQVVEIKAQSPGFFTQTLAPVTLHSGENVINITLNFFGHIANSVYGTVTYQNGGAVVGQNVVLLTNDGRLQTMGVTDASGKYSLYVGKSGDYSVAIVKGYSATSPSGYSYAQTDPDQSTVTFTDLYGQAAQRDMRIVDAQISGSNTLNLQVNGGTFAALKGLPNTKISLYNGNSTTSPLVTSGLTDGNGKIVFGRLANGNYTIKAEHDGYNTIISTVPVVQPTSNYYLLMSEISGGACINVPQASVKIFWFCGNEAIKMKDDPQFAAYWGTIDGTIGNLRATFGLSDLPAQVIIESSDLYQGAYNINNGCPAISFPKPGQSFPDKADEIILTTTFLKQNSSYFVSHIITHEWGHGKDFRTAHCTNFISSLNLPFTQARATAGKDAINQFLTDSHYDNDGAGHPFDNNTETYASSFHVGMLHESDFETRISKLDPTIKTALQTLVGITLKQPGTE